MSTCAKASLESSVLVKNEIKNVNSREEIATFANTSRGTVDKVKKIKEKAPAEVIQKLRDSEISINQAYTTIKREEKTLLQNSAEPLLTKNENPSIERKRFWRYLQNH